MDYRIPEKANKVLNIIILGFLLILVRVWYLSIIQHEEHLEKARKPKRRTVIEKIERATIRDRFNIPLALNKIQYNAAVCYADIRQIPSTKWEIGSGGKRVRIQKRLNYIKELSELLAKELNIDAQKVEDTIHGKASLFPHTPFVIKENLTETEYYRLKAKEKDWVGIRMEQNSQRYYPLGKVGCDVLGHLGAISLKEYFSIAQELKQLQAYLSERESGESPVLPKGFNNPLEVRERVKALQEKSYTIHDLTGKSGIESTFDAELRGYAGKKVYEVDTKGNVIRELPGCRKSLHGQRLLLSISSELQQFAEELLIANESLRELRHYGGEADLSAPWIKGGAIVAMDPHTGEVLALASYPRIDPNDFTAAGDLETKTLKQSAIHKWLEDETYIGEIWDGKRNLERERWDEQKGQVYNETLQITWDKYLEATLTSSSQIKAAIDRIPSILEAYQLQYNIQQLLEISLQDHVPTLIEILYSEGEHSPSRVAINLDNKQLAAEQLKASSGKVYELKRSIDPLLNSIRSNDDKLLLLDLCHLLISPPSISPELATSLKGITLSTHHRLNQAVSILKHFLKAQSKILFHSLDFQNYRESSFKEFLKEKRKQEKENKQYAKPYTDYLEEIEKEQFTLFWQSHGETLVHAYLFKETVPEELKSYVTIPPSADIEPHITLLKKYLTPLPSSLQKELLKIFRSFDELTSPLYGKYRSLRHSKGVQLEKHLAAAFYPLSGLGYGRSQAYRQSTPQGSVFKLVIGYQALLEKYETLKNWQTHFSEINPLTIVDNLKWHPKLGSPEQVLGSTIDGKPIIRSYKGGLLIRSHPNIGKIDLIGALEQSSNLYFSLLASDCVSNPTHLIDTSRSFGFGERTGIELPGEICGMLPNDLSHNRTGLYAFAIGQHSLVVTPLQTAVMLSALANKGNVLKPKVIRVIAGEEPLRDYQDPFSQTSYPFKNHLSSIGIDFPLFTALSTTQNDPYIWYHSPESKRQLPMPDAIREPLMEGMNRVIIGTKGSARSSAIRALYNNPQWAKDYQELKTQLIGKTGTAEILHKYTLDTESKAKIQNHIWFGGIAFSEDDHQTWEHPELTVVVYLRFSEAGGKEAAPLAAEVVKKYREIIKNHKQGAYLSP